MTGWKDKHCNEKERINQRIAALHGAYIAASMDTHAMYLDGTELRTTMALLAKDWPPSKLHIPNFCEHDYRAIQRKSDDQYGGRIHVHQQRSTDFLVRAPSQPWAETVRQAHEGHGPFSLVYLDYTSANEWPQDVGALCERHLLTPGAIFAVTCPSHVPHVALTEDRHVQAENSHVTRVGGHAVRGLDGPLAGLVKLEAALTRYRSRYHFACLEAFSYVSRETVMWVAVYRASRALPAYVLSNGLSFEYEERREQESSQAGSSVDHAFGSPAACEEQELEQFANIGNMMSSTPWPSVDAGPAAMTLEQELQRNLSSFRSHQSRSSSADPRAHAISMAQERQRREERREWDFLAAVYSAEDANICPYIQPLDMKAFALFKAGYNMDRLQFEGSMLAVDALMSDEPHLRGIGARVKLSGLRATEFNGLEGRILSEDRASSRIAIQLDNGKQVNVKLKKLKYHHSETGYYPDDWESADTTPSSSHVYPPIVPGARVELYDLQKAPELNGKRGVVERWDARQRRWQVRIDGDPKPRGLRSGNLSVSLS